MQLPAKQVITHERHSCPVITKCLGITYLLRRRVGRAPSVRRRRRPLIMGETHLSSEPPANYCKFESSRGKLTTFYLVEGAADERAARLKETQQSAHLTPDAHAHSCANVRSLSNRSPKPKRAVGTQVNSVQSLVVGQFEFLDRKTPPY